LFLWQVAHCTLEWAPVNGNLVVLWLKDAPAQVVVLWQEAHCLEKPA
jgi:hypothetical protein